MDVDLSRVPAAGAYKDALIMFSETASRFVVTVSPDKAKEFEQAMGGNVCAAIGFIRDDDRFLVRGSKGTRVVDTIIGALKDSWQSPLRW
jgi:phosphoribosylformylglycinamidine synthase